MSNETFVTRSEAEARDFEASLTEVESAVAELSAAGSAAPTSAYCGHCGCHHCGHCGHCGCHHCHHCGHCGCG
jgi:hypothetical protein